MQGLIQKGEVELVDTIVELWEHRQTELLNSYTQCPRREIL
jgi:hypothetical protein